MQRSHKIWVFLMWQFTDSPLACIAYCYNSIGQQRKLRLTGVKNLTITINVTGYFWWYSKLSFMLKSYATCSFESLHLENWCQQLIANTDRANFVCTLMDAASERTYSITVTTWRRVLDHGSRKTSWGIWVSLSLSLSLFRSHHLILKTMQLGQETSHHTSIAI
jgi:hypothetical protein